MILQGDVLQKLKELRDESVQSVITSPPYWGLRDYGVAGQIGLEPTIDEYIVKMVEVFREVRRVLRKDGTLWLNMGDSYSHGGNGARDPVRWPKQSRNDHRVLHSKTRSGLKPKDLIGMPWRVAFALQADGWYLRCDIIWSKLNPMPESTTDRPTKAHEYIFLMTKSGSPQFWTHRNLPGVRKNPKPDYIYVHESGREDLNEPEGWKDSTEWKRINLWTGHDYFYDAEAIKTPAATATINDKRGNEDGSRKDRGFPGNASNGGTNLGGKKKQKTPSGWNTDHKGSDLIGRYPGIGPKHAAARNRGEKYKTMAPILKVNRRSVWEIPTQPYPDAHFATFPEMLVKLCILAGSSAKGCCSECGAPWARIIEAAYKNDTTTDGRPAKGNRHKLVGDEIDRVMGYAERTRKITNTLGWQPTCECNAAVVPCTILDIFGGSGTTAKVAQDEGRDWIVIELNPEYIPMIEKRTKHRQEIIPGLL